MAVRVHHLGYFSLTTRGSAIFHWRRFARDGGKKEAARLCEIHAGKLSWRSLLLILRITLRLPTVTSASSPLVGAWPNKSFSIFKKEPRLLRLGSAIRLTGPDDRHRNAAQEDRHVVFRQRRGAPIIGRSAAVANMLVGFGRGREYYTTFPVATVELGIPRLLVFSKSAPKFDANSNQFIFCRPSGLTYDVHGLCEAYQALSERFADPI
jgi:hypothetical protein